MDAPNNPFLAIIEDEQSLQLRSLYIVNPSDEIYSAVQTNEKTSTAHVAIGDWARALPANSALKCDTDAPLRDATWTFRLVCGERAYLLEGISNCEAREDPIPVLNRLGTLLPCTFTRVDLS